METLNAFLVSFLIINDREIGYDAVNRYRQDGQKQMPAGTVSKAGDGQRPIYENDCSGPR